MPSKGLYKETLSEFEHVPVQKMTGRRPRFALIYASILRRIDLKPCDKLTLMVLDMESRNSDVIAVSHNAIANLAGIGRTTALASLVTLAQCGLIEAEGEPAQGKVQPYRLLYRELKRRAAPLVQCVSCHRPCKALAKTGWCKACAQRIDDDRLYQAAINVLGPDATPAEITMHYHTAKQSKRWIAAARRADASVRKTA